MLILSLIVLVFLPKLFFSHSIVPDNPLSDNDKTRFLDIFESTLYSKKPESSAWHYSILGFGIINKPFPKPSDACQLFKDTLTASPSVESIFHALEGQVILGTKLCQINLNNEISEKIKLNLLDSIKTGAAGKSVDILYYTVFSLKYMNIKFDVDKVFELLDSIVKSDSSAATMAYAFQIAVNADFPKPKLKRFYDEIEDVIQQADELDGKYLYYENGLFTTSFMVDAIYKLSGKYGQIPKISEDKLLKLSNYLLSRRYIYQPKAAAYLLLALRTLSQNQKMIPVCLKIVNGASIAKDSKGISMLKFELSDVWGVKINSNLKATVIKSVASSTVVSKDSIDLKFNLESQIYTLDLSSLKMNPGFYEVNIIGTGSTLEGTKILGLTSEHGAEFKFKIATSDVQVGPVSITSIELESSLSDSSESSMSTHSQSQYELKDVGKMLETKPKVDSHSKLQLTIPISDKTGNVAVPFRPHQCFLRLEHLVTGLEVFLIAEPDSKTKSDSDSVNMMITINALTQVKDFEYTSGDYSMELLISDPLMFKGILWKLGTASINVASAPEPLPFLPSASVHWGDAPRMPNAPAKPEIHHMFRPADQRASRQISFIFTWLCIAPLIILIFLWIKIGSNINGIFDCIFCAIPFHACLGGIFFIYYLYWTRWNMFTTLGFLVALGLPTFFFGNRLLKIIAVKRLQK